MPALDVEIGLSRDECVLVRDVRCQNAATLADGDDLGGDGYYGLFLERRQAVLQDVPQIVFGRDELAGLDGVDVHECLREGMFGRKGTLLCAILHVERAATLARPQRG